jgi:hypothetical protein
VINPSLFFSPLILSIPDVSDLATNKLITQVSGVERAAMLNKLGDLMVQHKDELAAIEALDNGKFSYCIRMIAVDLVFIEEKHSDMLCLSISRSRLKRSSTMLDGLIRLQARR